MKKNLLAIIVLAVIALGVYFLVGRKDEVLTSRGDTKFKIYQDTELEFEIKYPENWKIGEIEYERIFEVVFDPVKVLTKEEIDGLDLYPGLISIRFEQKRKGEGDLRSIVGYESMEKVKIGEGLAIDARKSETTFLDDAPNPAYFNSKNIAYYIHRDNLELPEVIIEYISDLETHNKSENFKIFNEMLGSLKLF